MRCADKDLRAASHAQCLRIALPRGREDQPNCPVCARYGEARYNPGLDVPWPRRTCPCTCRRDGGPRGSSCCRPPHRGRCSRASSSSWRLSIAESEAKRKARDNLLQASTLLWRMGRVRRAGVRSPTVFVDESRQNTVSRAVLEPGQSVVTNRTHWLSDVPCLLKHTVYFEARDSLLFGLGTTSFLASD